jgi:hypothetical protein
MSSASTVKDVYVGLLERVCEAAPNHAPTKELLAKAIEAPAKVVADKTETLVQVQNKIRSKDLDFFCSDAAPEEVRALRLGEIRELLPPELVDRVFDGLGQALMVHMAMGMLPAGLRDTVEAASAQLTGSLAGGGQFDAEALAKMFGTIMGSFGARGLAGPSAGGLAAIAEPSIEPKELSEREQKVAAIRKRMNKKLVNQKR